MVKRDLFFPHSVHGAMKITSNDVQKIHYFFQVCGRFLQRTISLIESSFQCFTLLLSPVIR